MMAVIAAGGTGGHILPGMVLAETLKERRWDIRFISRHRDLTLIRQLRRYKKNMLLIDAAGLDRKNILKALSFFLKLIRNIRICKRYLEKIQPDIVIGMGGFMSAAPIVAANRLKIPAVLCEQNAIPGLANRWLSRRVKTVMTTYTESNRFFKNAVTVGNPIRPHIGRISKTGGKRALGIRSRKPVLFITCGSQGAKAINDCVTEALPKLKDFHILWSCGQAHFREIKKAVKPYAVTLLPFIMDIAPAWAAADVVVCRAGATTLAELATAGVPAVIIPYPYATNKHQHANAQPFSDTGGALVIDQRELTPASLIRLVRTVYRRRIVMGKKIKKLSHASAAEKSADVIAELLTQRN